MNNIKFSQCNCEIEKGIFNINQIPLDCPATWALISSGFTTGIFQLETRLGQDWARKVKPSNIQELAALIALVRPGCLESGQSEEYVDVKFGRKKLNYLHPCLENILGNTYGCLVYQEQAIKIATEIAGFSLENADELRKAMGKKIPELMSKLKIKFMEGCLKKGLVTKEIAEQIFGWIEKSQRYSFNKCLSGKTIIKRSNNGKHKCILTIEEMYKIRNDIEYAKKRGHLSLYKKWKLINSYGNGLSLFKDNRIRKNIIKDIRYSGTQKLYRITLKDNSYIDVTHNHKFPTPDGEKQCCELEVGDKLFTCGKYEPSDFAKINKFSDKKQNSLNKKYTNNKSGFPFGSNNPSYTNGSYSKFEKFKEETPNICYTCGKRNIRIETHHRDGDRTNSEPKNLVKLCSSCHKKEEYKNGRIKQFEKGYPALRSEIKSIIYIGEEETYDIEMEGPNHNFVTSENIITCNSHAISYAMLGYQSGWIKTHFPNEFFTSYLTFSNYKSDPKEEVYKLVQDARLFGIDVLPPDTRMCNVYFKMMDNGIRFGLSNIRGVGQSAITKIIEQSKSLSTWNEFLKSLPVLHRSIGIALIKSGACDCYNMERSQMIKELEIIFGTTIRNKDGKNEEIRGLTEKERTWFFSKLIDNRLIKDVLFEMIQQAENSLSKSLSSLKKEDIVNWSRKILGEQFDFSGLTKQDIINKLKENGYDETSSKSCVTGKRLQIIKEKHQQLLEEQFDTNLGKSTAEKYFLGISLSCSPADDADDSNASHNCLDLMKCLNGESFSVCAVIDNVKHTKTKKGKNPGSPMCFLTISDSSYSIDHAVVFPDVYEKMHSLCKDGLICLVTGHKQNGSIIVQNLQKLI